MSMVENLLIEVYCVSENCFSIQVFGAIMGVVGKYEEVDEFIEEFCDEWNIDTFTLMIKEH